MWGQEGSWLGRIMGTFDNGSNGAQSVSEMTLFLDSMSVPWCKALHLWPWGRAPQTGPQAMSRKKEEAGKAEYLLGSQLLWGQNIGTDPQAPQHVELEAGQASLAVRAFHPT